MEQEFEWFSEEGMRRGMEEIMLSFRERMRGTVAEKMPMYVHECSFQERTLTVRIPLTPWMADRTGDMSNGALSTALDQSMGILSLYFARGRMTPTITMQLSLLRPIPLDRPIYIKSTMLSSNGDKNDLTALVWSEGMEDHPACTAVGMYYMPPAAESE
ncbi:MAG: hypothetical protein IJ751_07215 [Oscillospiraceae bacterium]|nr:hypothetical protein [Oscillospiraceae bacterium]